MQQKTAELTSPLKLAAQWLVEQNQGNEQALLNSVGSGL
jgi:hypothetical protein